MFLWVAGFAVLVASKLHYPFEQHKVYGKSLGDVTYYVGEHLGRFLLMLGAVSMTFMLERYDYYSRWFMYAKNVALTISGVFFVRMIGEIFTASDISKYEVWLHGVVLVATIYRIVNWLIKHRHHHHGN